MDYEPSGIGLPSKQLLMRATEHGLIPPPGAFHPSDAQTGRGIVHFLESDPIHQDGMTTFFRLRPKSYYDERPSLQREDTVGNTTRCTTYRMARTPGSFDLIVDVQGTEAGTAHKHTVQLEVTIEEHSLRIQAMRRLARFVFPEPPIMGIDFLEIGYGLDGGAENFQVVEGNGYDYTYMTLKNGTVVTYDKERYPLVQVAALNDSNRNGFTQFTLSAEGQAVRVVEFANPIYSSLIVRQLIDSSNLWTHALTGIVLNLSEWKKETLV